jgi:hypothetical protein
MSIISTAAHSVVDYDPKTSKAFTGQRLSKVTYKTVTDKSSELYGIKRPSKCVSLPLIAKNDVVANITALAPYVVEYLHSVQDKIIRERVDAGAAHITTEEVSISAICEWLDTNNESGRLTKESVAAWFNENVAENLAVTLAEKLGVSSTPTDAESNKILAVVDVFKGKISSLAGGKTAYEPKVCTSLINALSLAPAGDVLATRFTARLEKMIAEYKADDELLTALL